MVPSFNSGPGRSHLKKHASTASCLPPQGSCHQKTGLLSVRQDVACNAKTDKVSASPSSPEYFLLLFFILQATHISLTYLSHTLPLYQEEKSTFAATTMSADIGPGPGSRPRGRPPAPARPPRTAAHTAGSLDLGGLDDPVGSRRTFRRRRRRRSPRGMSPCDPFSMCSLILKISEDRTLVQSLSYFRWGL